MKDIVEKSGAVRQATYADIPLLVELAQPILSLDDPSRDVSDIASHFARHIERVGYVVLVSEQSFAIGINSQAMTGDDTTVAAFTLAWAENGAWPDLVWAAEAWAESMGARELRFGILSDITKAKEEISALGFGLQSVFMSRPVEYGATTAKDIEQ
ncbi:hypothetical protein J3R80_05830 [Aliiroseovarius sp. Z3]|uniref:hypothetical protein n=1 Tax=Aliiroseovarius sp. Z3 TaxID=2811402 RepID=UPI0023B31487|nr:hypothetical protein [Aliiroseovarius sp. Z3]MDE9449986.1 hypothetical protein [Aliiroseovarius sp. Z3]